MWCVTDVSGNVVHGFDADPSYIDNFEDRVINRQETIKPLWWNEEVTFHDVTDVEPRPIAGFFRTEAGEWVDGNPSIAANRYMIPADGVTAATVTYTQKGSKATSVTFNINGNDVIEKLSAGSASVDVASSNPGDTIIIAANGVSVTITVEG